MRLWLTEHTPWRGGTVQYFPEQWHRLAAALRAVPGGARVAEKIVALVPPPGGPWDKRLPTRIDFTPAELDVLLPVAEALPDGG